VIGTKDPNSKIVLDALPSKYDFPALATSLEKILTDGGYKIESIIGTDDEANQNLMEESPDPQPVEMPFEITAGGSYPAIQKLINDFERSIRPFNVTSLELSGTDDNMRIDMQAKTYYQPEKTLEIKTKVVR
jgi:Tfp pilus assembly protein PilO